MKRPNYKLWTLVSNGPSILEMDQDDFPQGPPIVAVNHAVMNVRADVWACHENHSGIWETLLLKAGGPRQDGPLGETWVAHGHLDHWRTHIRGERAFRRKPTLDLVPVLNRTRDWAYRDMPWKGSEVLWGERSVLAAVGHMVIRGAERIVCFGVDMEGPTNSGGGPCVEENRRVHKGLPWDERWRFERAQWELLTTECAEHGVELIRETT